MKRTIHVLGRAMLASLALGVVLVAIAMAAAGSLDPIAIRIDGEQIDLAHLGVAEGLFAIGGIAIALLVCVLVVPLAVLIPLAIVAVALVGVLIVLAGVLAVVFSPLILALLAVWLIVRRVRRSERKASTTSNATIAG